MGMSRLGCAGLAVLATGLLLIGCPGPVHDPFLMREVKAEARALVERHPTWGVVEVPKSRWPPAIASLRPEFVWVRRDGIEIATKPYFDGGWGYHVTWDDQGRPEPAERYTEVEPGIYWYAPY